MAFFGLKSRRRERRGGQDGSRPRPLGCLWPMFWLILLIVLLGLLVGGYHKGTKIGSQSEVGGWSARSSGSAQGKALFHSRVY